MERKIALVENVYFKPLTTIRCHDLHVGDIKKVVGEITSYHERD